MTGHDSENPDARWVIQALLHEYAYRFDSGDFDGFAELFANGTLDLRGIDPPARGVAEVRDLLHRRVILYEDGTPRTNHLMHNMVIDVTGDATASASTYVQVLQAPPGSPIETIATGIYRDRLTRGDDGSWEFTHRTVEGSLSGDLTKHLRSLRNAG